MEIWVIVALIGALWFFYQGIQHWFAWIAQPLPNRTFPPLALCIYCLCAGILLLYEGGFLHRAVA